MNAPADIFMTPKSAMLKTELPRARLGKMFPRIGFAPPADLGKTPFPKSENNETKPQGKH